jgi:hypothetical protein
MMNRGAFCRTMISLVILTFCGSALTDTWAPHRARIFASRLGWYGVKAIPKFDDRHQTTTQLYLFRLNKSGKEVVLWTSDVAGYPMGICVGDDGQVLLFDCQTEAVVVLSSDGTVAFRYRLEDLLTPHEVKAHVVETASSKRWRDSRTLVEFFETRASITLSWGKCIYIDLETGRISANPAP